MKSLGRKIVAFYFLALILSLALPAKAESKSTDKKTICKVVTNDVGTIIGSGRDPAAAYEDAAEKCFSRHEKLHKMKKSVSSLDEDTGLVIIDVCANIKCG